MNISFNLSTPSSCKKVQHCLKRCQLNFSGNGNKEAIADTGLKLMDAFAQSVTFKTTRNVYLSYIVAKDLDVFERMGMQKVMENVNSLDKVAGNHVVNGNLALLPGKLHNNAVHGAKLEEE